MHEKAEDAWLEQFLLMLLQWLQSEAFRAMVRLISALIILLCMTLLTLHLLLTPHTSEYRMLVVGILLALVKALASLIGLSTALVARRHIRS